MDWLVRLVEMISGKVPQPAYGPEDYDDGQTFVDDCYFEIKTTRGYVLAPRDSAKLVEPTDPV